MGAVSVGESALSGMECPFSLLYMNSARDICLRLLMHTACCPLRLAEDSAGSSIAARMAMMAITTSSSIRVNPA